MARGAGGTAQGGGLREGDSTRRRAAREEHRKAPGCERGSNSARRRTPRSSGITILYCRQNIILSANKQDVALCVSQDLLCTPFYSSIIEVHEGGFM
eukprot:1694388-Pleurochrysis_carterae.AAC.1